MATYSDPALILPGAVGQTELDAASKKDVVGGVAALDASGFVLAKGAGILFPRTGSNDVHIYERTAGEEAYAFHRVGADDYTFYIKESNVWKRFLTESMKGVANGIAGLDGSADVLLAQIPDALTGKKTDLNAVAAADSYIGNDTVNRAIPHGLGVEPKFVISLKTGEGATICINVTGNSINGNDSTYDTVRAVTMWDATNFYVGNAGSFPQSANQNTKAYAWVAFV